MILSYDFDGVVSTGDFLLKNDGKTVIVTGRCFDESPIVYNKLAEFRIDRTIPVFFNPIPLERRGTDTIFSRTMSAIHKAHVLGRLRSYDEVTHYEDDPLQLSHIEDGGRSDIILVLVPGFVEPKESRVL